MTILRKFCVVSRGGGLQIAVATEQEPKKLAASSEQKPQPPLPPVLNKQPMVAVSNMKHNRPEPEPVEYLIENQQTAVFAIPNFAQRPHKRGKKITTTKVVQVGGHPFKLWIYPRGIDLDTDTEYVAIYLRYEGENTEANPVNARFQIRTKKTKENKRIFECKFASSKPYGGSQAFKKRENIIQDDLDENGTLTIEVDITIGKLGRTTGGAGTHTVTHVVHNAVSLSGNNAVGVGNKKARTKQIPKIIEIFSEKALAELINRMEFESEDDNDEVLRKLNLVGNGLLVEVLKACGIDLKNTIHMTAIRTRIVVNKISWHRQRVKNADFLPVPDRDAAVTAQLLPIADAVRTSLQSLLASRGGGGRGQQDQITVATEHEQEPKKPAASLEVKPPPGQAEGATLLHFYAKVGNFRKVREYVPVPVRAGNAGTTTNSFDVQDTNGWTPLHEAVRGGYLTIVKCLVEEHKVNLTTQTKTGQSPLQLSQHYDRGNPHLHPVTVYLQERLLAISSQRSAVGAGNKKGRNGNGTASAQITSKRGGCGGKVNAPTTISSSSTITASTSTIGAKGLMKSSEPSSITKEEVLAALAPCQRKAINFVKEKAKKRHEDALLKLKNRLPHLDDGSYTEEDLTQALGYIRDEANIVIHMNKTAVGTLVNDTHYRNRFETQASGSTGKYAVSRQKWEHGMFSSCYDDVPASMRVKYGCLNYCGDIRGVKSARERYGPAHIVLKPHVRFRATFSLESKSTRSEIIATNEYYAYVLHEYGDTELKKVLDVCKFARHGGRPSDCTKYKEVQIHGPICLATDIQALSIPGRQKDAGVSLARNVESFRKMTNCNILWQEDLLDPDDTKSNTDKSKKSNGTKSTKISKSKSDKGTKASKFILKSKRALPETSVSSRVRKRRRGNS